MAVTAISGTKGSITGASFAANVHKWEFSSQSAVHEYAVFGDFARSAVPGKRRHIGSCDFVVVDGTDELSNIEGSPAAAVSCTFIATGTKGFSVDVIPERITLTHDMEGIGRGTMTFVADGAATYDETA